MANPTEFEVIEESWYDGRAENGIPACTVCGAPIHPVGGYPIKHWDYYAVLLRDPSLDFRCFPSLSSLPVSLLSQERQITRHRAEALAFTCFKLLDGDEKGKVVMANQTGGEFHAELFISMHEACMEIVDRFLAVGYIAPPPLPAKPWSLSMIWDVVRLRIEVDQHTEYKGLMDEVMEVNEPHGYFAPPKNHLPFFQGWAMEDPLEVPLDFNSITTPWRQAENKDCRNDDMPGRAVARLRQGYVSLPQELQDYILDFIVPGDDFGIHCNRILSSDTWRRMLIEGRLTPWLWEIDPSKLPDAESVDYEAMVRQLSQADILKADVHEYTGYIMGSGGLWNRRRIWRVLETMRAGDLPMENSRNKLSIFRNEEEEKEKAEYVEEWCEEWGPGGSHQSV
ncbi:hypothetical protein KC349_g1594 [Hortaea werneckii]|nr:hypothetical protein KC349_g1594 [Hortaea werneckii]